MSAKILVVDDIPANVRVLEARLEAAYYSVVTAQSGAEALQVARAEQPDLILLDVMMPGMDGFECCRRLKADPALASIPVVMVTALDQARDRVAGLEAGADDFLTKPPHDLALFARVRSSLRVKMMIDELNMRDETFREFGVSTGVAEQQQSFEDKTILMVDGRVARAEAVADALQARLGARAEVAATAEEALTQSHRAPADAYLVSSAIGEFDGLRLCSQLRSQQATRQSSLLLIVDHEDFERAAEGLDLGVDDYLMRPIDETEMAARVRAQLRRKAFADRLRQTLQSGLRMAMTDSLTGLYNRRYADHHLTRQVSERERGGGRMALILMDIDHFKKVNDQHGHAAGDQVLVEFARRLQRENRSADLVARYGGEEFLVAMPDVSLKEGVSAADRIRSAVARDAFHTDAGPLSVTISAGVAALELGESAHSLMRRADVALYDAKTSGRDCVKSIASPEAERLGESLATLSADPVLLS
ncbi:MAG: PleD family two-component system response regulator [Pseudomonadota bacterium]